MFNCNDSQICVLLYGSCNRTGIIFKAENAFGNGEQPAVAGCIPDRNVCILLQNSNHWFVHCFKAD